MEDEIKEELKKIYKDEVKIDVHFKDFRWYNIDITINRKKTGFNYLWNSMWTKEANIWNIEEKINNEIIEFYKI